jgi:caffeoyl-CoA O-methyltransferase
MADEGSRSGTTYGSRSVLDYVEKVHARADGALELARTAPSRHGLPAIHIGASEGRALELFLRLIGAQRVVEIGTLAGYSALWMARALPVGGRLWSIELEASHAAIARESIRAAGLVDRVEVCVGPALEILPTLTPHGPFDAVFVDADKGNYDRYGRWAAQNLREGGLLLGDNSFYFGRLLSDGEDARAMRRFHEELSGFFESVCLPTPDGLVLAIRNGIRSLPT